MRWCWSLGKISIGWEQRRKIILVLLENTGYKPTRVSLTQFLGGFEEPLKTLGYSLKEGGWVMISDLGSNTMKQVYKTMAGLGWTNSCLTPTVWGFNS